MAEKEIEIIRKSILIELLGNPTIYRNHIELFSKNIFTSKFVRINDLKNHDGEKWDTTNRKKAKMSVVIPKFLERFIGSRLAGKSKKAAISLEKLKTIM